MDWACVHKNLHVCTHRDIGSNQKSLVRVMRTASGSEYLSTEVDAQLASEDCLKLGN